MLHLLRFEQVRITFMAAIARPGGGRSMVFGQRATEFGRLIRHSPEAMPAFDVAEI